MELYSAGYDNNHGLRGGIELKRRYCIITATSRRRRIRMGALLFNTWTKEHCGKVETKGGDLHGQHHHQPFSWDTIKLCKTEVFNHPE
jgi:hypothetical protein